MTRLTGASRLAFCLLVLFAAVVPSQCLLAEKPKRLHVVGQVNEGFVRLAEKAHDSIPNAVWKQVDEAGWSVQLAEFVVDAAPFLRGRRPRGWPEDAGWEQTDAVHLPDHRWIIVAEKRRTTRGDVVAANRVAGVLRHELGHAVDQIRGSNGARVTESAAFQHCYSRDIQRMTPAIRRKLAYYLQPAPGGPREVFAELFANQFGGGSDRDKVTALNAAFPLTRELLQNVVAQATQTKQSSSLDTRTASE